MSDWALLSLDDIVIEDMSCVMPLCATRTVGAASSRDPIKNEVVRMGFVRVKG